MMMRKILIAFIFFAAYTQNASAQKDSINIILQTIESLYNAGSYVSTELEARRLLECPDLSDSIRVAVHKCIAFSLIAQGKTELAKEQFLSMLKIAPDYDLDPVYTSPKILVIFREIQRHFLSKKFRKDTIDDPMSAGYNTVTYRTIIFPGWEQLHQKRAAAGRVFLGAGITTLGAGIVFEFLRGSARRNYLSETDLLKINDKYDTYNRYYKAEIISFIAFAAVYIVSEIDALYARHDLQLSIESDLIRPRGTTLTFNVHF